MARCEFRVCEPEFPCVENAALLTAMDSLFMVKDQMMEDRCLVTIHWMRVCISVGGGEELLPFKMVKSVLCLPCIPAANKEFKMTL